MTTTIDIPKKLLNKLKCGLCDEYLSYPPIKLYAETGSVCGRCPELEGEKNIQPIREESYENVASILSFPCRYNLQGCMEELTMKEMPTHEQSCVFKPYFCPVVPLGSCAWQGSASELHGHFAIDHLMMLLEHPVFELDLIDNHKENYLLPSMGELFLVKNEFDTKDQMIFFSVHFIGAAEYAEKYEYHIMFTGDANVTWVAPKKQVQTDVDILARLQETSVSLANLSSILDEPSTITCRININMRAIGQKPLIIISDLEEEEYSADSADSEDDEEEIKLANSIDQMLIDIECPVCQEYMIPPIFQCVIGHSICGICKPKLNECPTCKDKIGNTRNFTLEKITENLNYQCCNRSEGCTHVTNSKNIRKHENECKYSPHRCPLKDSHQCDWMGNIQKIFNHIKSEHKDSIQSDAFCTIQYNSSAVSYEIFKMIKVHGEIFRVRYNYCNQTKQVACTVQCLGIFSDASKFMYEMHVIDVSNRGLQLMSKKYCGSIRDNPGDIKHSTLWYLDMVTPFMSSDNLLKIKCVICKV